MNVAIVIPTYNRLEYTQKVIPRLLEDPQEDFELYLWDNASVDETAEYLKSLDDPRIKEVHISKTNEGQVGAMNWAWSKTSAELVGKLDNDCLVTPGWTKTLAHAHLHVPQLGAIACWHFPLELFDYHKADATGKMQTFSGHTVLRHPWVCGSGFIMKKDTFEKMGNWDIGKDVGTTGYFLKMAIRGYVNGWYYPLIWQEHMDDPVSSHSMLKSDEEIIKRKQETFSLRFHNVNSIEQRIELRNKCVNNLLVDPWQADYYIGWQKFSRKLKDKIKRYFGINSQW